MSLGVLISGNGSTMQAVLDVPEINVSVVISSNANAYGIIRAKRMGVPVEILPIELKSKENKPASEKWFLETLRKYRVTKLMLAGFMRILSSEFISNFKMETGGEIINIHPSLLPAYKGKSAFEDAIEHGETNLGVTMHHVVLEVDAGATILQRKFKRPPESASMKLSLHIHEQEAIKTALRKTIMEDRK